MEEENNKKKEDKTIDVLPVEHSEAMRAFMKDIQFMVKGISSLSPVNRKVVSKGDRIRMCEIMLGSYLPAIENKLYNLYIKAHKLEKYFKTKEVKEKKTNKQKKG